MEKNGVSLFPCDISTDQIYSISWNFGGLYNAAVVLPSHGLLKLLQLPRRSLQNLRARSASSLLTTWRTFNPWVRTGEQGEKTIDWSNLFVPSHSAALKQNSKSEDGRTAFVVRRDWRFSVHLLQGFGHQLWISGEQLKEIDGSVGCQWKVTFAKTFYRVWH